MPQKKRLKQKLHPRNRNREDYDMSALTKVCPELSQYVFLNKHGNNTVDFANPSAVKFLNKAILKHYYGILYWNFPDENLCPPIPGRADYLHVIADLLGERNNGVIPKGASITCLDIGVGASCIYPIIGVVEYDWNFICTDIDQKSIDSAKHIVKENPILKDKIVCRLQPNYKQIFENIISRSDKVDVVLCNPPFHNSIEDAQKENRRKVRNLSGQHDKPSSQNFSGKNNELVYKGGELKFINNMINESVTYANQCHWFTSLVSKQSNLDDIYKSLHRVKASTIKTISMGTGNKNNRMVAWTFK